MTEVPDDVWARAAAGRSGSKVLAGLSVLVLVAVVHQVLLAPAGRALGPFGSVQRALLGLAFGVALWTPLLVWSWRTRGTRDALPLRLQAWVGWVVVLSGPAWLPGHHATDAQEAAVQRLGWALGVLPLLALVLGPTCLWLTTRRRTPWGGHRRVSRSRATSGAPTGGPVRTPTW